jgi:hypothetical protein
MNELKEMSVHFLGPIGKLLSASKSRYRDNHPDNFVIFNANVCTDEGKIWWGDLDITISKENLQSLAIATNTKIYVLYEMDARFENEDFPLLKNSAATFHPSGEIESRYEI